MVTAICDMRPDDHEPTYRGYGLSELVEQSTFDEVVYLLLFGRLPSAAQLDEFRATLAAAFCLPGDLLDLLRRLPSGTHPLDALRISAAYLGAVDPEAGSPDEDAEQRKAVRMVARLPAAAAAGFRLSGRLEPVRPLREPGYTRNLLVQIAGYFPDEAAVQILDALFIINADGESDASTYAARVIASSLADVSSSITAAIGSLKGSLCGGGIGAAMRFLRHSKASMPFSDGHAAGIPPLPGFFLAHGGQADPKAEIMKRLSLRLGHRIGDLAWHHLCERLETAALERGFTPAASLYAAAIFLMLLIPDILAAPLLAAVRAAGWAAHSIEQRGLRRIINPHLSYCGPALRNYLPLAERSGLSPSAA